jgi:hypothetical protein
MYNSHQKVVAKTKNIAYSCDDICYNASVSVVDCWLPLPFFLALSNYHSSHDFLGH